MIHRRRFLSVVLKTEATLLANGSRSVNSVLAQDALQKTLFHNSLHNKVPSMSNVLEPIMLNTSSFNINTNSNKNECDNMYQAEHAHQIFTLPEHGDQLKELFKENPSIQILDTIEDQLKDLIKLENPTLHPMSNTTYQSKIIEKLNGTPIQEYGNWVYYPWRNSLVHVLGEEDFIRVRTIRNAFKISPQEQQELHKKTVLVVGLSVGQAAAMILAMERSCGHLILADFDHIDLSNMNRLRASVMDLGIMKGTVIKRAIAELDPYFKVTFLRDGLNKNNISTVLGNSQESKLVDLVIEECDSFDTKVLIRKHCKKAQIPVIMETSDRGLLDVERFDLDKDYPILHGLIDSEMLQVEDEFSPEQKRKLVLQFLDAGRASKRGIYSFTKVGKTITSWPQLASEVQFGSSVAGMVTRMILLGENVPSQRHYLDIPQKVSSFVEENMRRTIFEKVSGFVIGRVGQFMVNRRSNRKTKDN